MGTLQKNKKKTVLALIATLLLAAPGVVQAQFSCSTNADGTLTITQYTGANKVVAIPTNINGLTVSVIGYPGFYQNASVTAVAIPSTINNIAGSAFGYCTALTNVTIDNGLTNIGEYAFFDCNQLLNINFPSSLSAIGSDAFDYCGSLTSLTIDVPTLVQRAFYDCGTLTNVTLGNNVNSIGSGAFANDGGLTKITIPVSVTNIESPPFIGCTSLTAIIVDSNNAFYSSLNGVFFDKNQTTLLEFPSQPTANYAVPDTVTSIAYAAFDRVYVTNVTISTGVTSIGQWAFANSSALMSITIPNTVTNIGPSPFQGCPSLISVSIPSSVTNFGNVFYGCPSLTNVTIDNGVTSIVPDEFDGCTTLGSVTIPDSVTSIGADAFENCASLTSITVDSNNSDYSSVNGVLFDKRQTTLIQYPLGLGGGYAIPDTVTSIGQAAFANCTGLANATVSQGVASIEDFAFYGCSSLTSITIPGSVANIGEYAFQDCSRLTNVTIAKGVPNIGAYAFYGCNGLTSITIPASVTAIGQDAFAYCSALATVTIPASVTAIGDYAYAWCGSLTNATIPASVTNIGYALFAASTALTSVYFQGNAPAVVGNVYDGPAFYSDNSTTVYYLPSTTGWSNAFSGAPALLWNPRIQASAANFGMRSNQFGFNITGTANIPVAVQACTNLANPVWMSLTNVTLTNGLFYFSEPFQANTPDRYYRISSP